MAWLGNPVISGYVVEAAALFHAAVVGVGADYGEVAFKSLDDTDEGTLFVAQGDCPGMHGNAVSGLVVNETHGFDRPGRLERGCEGAFSSAHFAADLIAMQKNVFGAEMAKDVDAGVAGDLFGAVAPEDDFFLQVDYAHADLQAVEDIAISLGIGKGRHSCARVVLICSSARTGGYFRGWRRKGRSKGAIQPKAGFTRVWAEWRDGTLGTAE
jgi:hypothetical protein